MEEKYGKKISHSLQLKCSDQTEPPDTSSEATSSIPAVSLFDVYECVSCRGRFPTVSDIYHHVHKDHSISKEKLHGYIVRFYKCQFDCGEEFICEAYREKHERYKHSNRSSTACTCSICGKTCGTKYVLNAHMRTHTGKKLKCSTCEKTFLYPHSLKEHEKCCEFGPGGNQRYSCSICAKKKSSDNFPHKMKQHLFKSIKTLKQHIRAVHNYRD